MKLSFWGAARQVTGSMFLLELPDDYRILIDCGTNLEAKSAPSYETGMFPFDASLINLVILTHAHIDHSGQIPNLYRAGYEGQVICTEPTLDLAELLLHDAANLHQLRIKRTENSKKLSKKGKAEANEPYYQRRDVEQAIDNFVPLSFHKRFKFKDGAWLTFIPAGHLLGAAHVLLEIEREGELVKIGFSGDIGRKNYPLLPDPELMDKVDYLICETTYGNRRHEEKSDPMLVLEKIIKDTCIDIKGRLIIPTFSVGRTQALLYTLNKLYTERGFNQVKVFTDSPLAKSSTAVHEKYLRYLNKEARDLYKEEDAIFDFENLFYLKSSSESKELSYHTEPCIIISSSGMLQGGRIEHHIAENIENPYATVLFIGYTTEGTLGAKLRDKDIRELNIQGARKEVKAKILSTDVFSGHGDLDDLLSFVNGQISDRLKKVFLVHGETESMINFKSVLEDKNVKEVFIPEFGETFEL